MSAYIGTQPASSARVRPEVPIATSRPMPMPQFDRGMDLTPTQLEVLDLVRKDIRVASSVQPIHRVLANTYSLPSTKNFADEITDELAALRSSKVPLAVKALIVGAGLAASVIFATSNILPSPGNKIWGVLAAFITLFCLPIVDYEFTGRRLSKEFETHPLKSDNLPSLAKILDEGCTPEQFGAFVNDDLLPRVPIRHARSVASDCGTCLHDVIFWRRGVLSFPSTTWEMVHKVIEDLGVGEEVSLRAKAALLAIERARTSNEESLLEIDRLRNGVSDVFRKNK